MVTFVKQVIQNVRTGELSVAEVPAPRPQPGHVLIANAASVISAGTEKMVMDLASQSLLGKARQRPDQVRRVLEKIRNEGLIPAVRAVRARLDEPMTMGYASAGVVLAVGDGVQEYKPGDRVASNGPHAGVVSVAKHLCARVPEGVPLDHAAFTVLGAIAMQSVRLSRATLGETVFVIGLGLVGQLVVALLRAAGCRVIGTDLETSKCELAIKMGANVARPGLGPTDIEAATGGLGADAILIAASTESKGPMDLAAAAVRQKGRIVLVGVVGLELDRRPFYFKEAELVVSCSYGPGRYDPGYEEHGHDYPPAYVRWTEQRNMQAVLDLMGRGLLDVTPLVSHRFPIEGAKRAYELIERGDEPYMGIVLEYPGVDGAEPARRIELGTGRAEGAIGITVLGAGSFARTVLLPAIRGQTGLRPTVVCSARGVSAGEAARKFGFEAATTDEEEAIDHPGTGAVFVLTRHHQHARQVVRALRAGKHVFVEKPLCLTEGELAEIEAALAERSLAPLLLVGFNRRFSPAARHVRSFFQDVAAPLTVTIRFNAGAIPPDHWIQNEAEGGGRIIGEACHAIDLATYLTGSPPVRVFAESIGGPNAPRVTDDQCFITLRHANGSISSVAYLSAGDTSYPKEHVEVIGGGRLAVIEDFWRVTTVAGGRRRVRRQRQDKGHWAEIGAFARAVADGAPAPIPWEEIRGVSLASIRAVQSLREGLPLEV